MIRLEWMAWIAVLAGLSVVACETTKGVSVIGTVGDGGDADTGGDTTTGNATDTDSETDSPGDAGLDTDEEIKSTAYGPSSGGALLTSPQHTVRLVMGGSPMTVMKGSRYRCIIGVGALSNQ